MLPAPKKKRKRTLGAWARKARQCLAVTQPRLPPPPMQLPCEAPARPLHPCLGVMVAGRLVRLFELNQFAVLQSGSSPKAPTLLYVAPPSVEYWKVMPSYWRSTSQKILKAMRGLLSPERSKQGLSSQERSLLL